MTDALGMTRRPVSTDFAPYYADYVARVPAGDLIAILEEQFEGTAALLSSEVALDGADYRYAPEKWSLKQVVCHLCDVERVLSYRLLRFARADATPLAGFEENEYAIASEADARTLPDLVSELRTVRAATLALLRGLPFVA